MEPPCIGLPMIIMVNEKGLAMSMRTVEAMILLKELGK